VPFLATERALINTPHVSDASATQGPAEGDSDRLASSRPSKTKIKNSLERFRKFAVELIELPQGRFNQLEFPEEIKEALIEARKLTSLGARRRQMSFVARLVEELDIESIRETLRNLDHGRSIPKPTPETPSETVVLTEAEVMAEQLLDGDDQTVFALPYPFGPAERQNLRLFVRKKKKTLQAGGNRTELRKDLAKYLGTLRSTIGQDSY
jgi:ribosome-associated protein